MERFRKQKEIEQKETEELIQLADVLRKELTDEKIEEIMVENLQYFEDVKTAGIHFMFLLEILILC